MNYEHIRSMWHGFNEMNLPQFKNKFNAKQQQQQNNLPLRVYINISVKHGFYISKQVNF